MFKEVSTWVGGIGSLIAVYLVATHASEFSQLTTSIASASSGLISTLQGRGGTTSLSGATLS